ncbi:hypothetical protein JTB14_037947 [Gonioctena quinquepunctata]|nr:hypothetical protein JTB14_037947 [Gonioctena quinquepunctata]
MVNDKQVLTAAPKESLKNCSNCNDKLKISSACELCQLPLHIKCGNRISMDDKGMILTCVKCSKSVAEREGQPESENLDSSISSVVTVLGSENCSRQTCCELRKEVILLRQIVEHMSERIKLMNFKIDVLESHASHTNTEGTKVTRPSAVHTISDGNHAAPTHVNPDIGADEWKHVSHTTEETQFITRDQVSSALHEVESNLECQKFIELNHGPAQRSNPFPKGRKSYRGTNKPIVGKSPNCSTAGINKTCLLHVYKLTPSTTTEELLRDIKGSFPEAKIEKINSMFPQLYSSFTVCINQCNLEKAWDESVWPMGAHVRRFFLKRRVPPETS